MDQSKIFIASSEKAQRLAETIRDVVNEDDYCRAATWKDALESCGAQSKIEALERWIQTYDFAAILFTEGDLWAKQAGQDLKSRDDCIFEAGLFMATLGRQRCFLLTSLDPGALPSDLGGITAMKFKEPDDMTNYAKCRPPAQLVAGRIKAQVQQMTSDQSPGRRPLTRQDILKRERMESQGGMLREDQVVAAYIQPPEVSDRAAKQVRANMDENVSYVYFFRGTYDAVAEKIPQLLQLILIADYLDEKSPPLFKARGELVMSRGKEILDLLENMCYNDNLNIFFLKTSVYPEYSIHNATNDKLARLYFKRNDDYFLEWAFGLEAYRFWRDIKDENGVDNPDLPGAIFHGGRNFELNEAGFRKALWNGMRKYFGTIAEDVMGLCLSGRDYQRRQPGAGAPAAVAQPAS